MSSFVVCFNSVHKHTAVVRDSKLTNCQESAFLLNSLAFVTDPLPERIDPAVSKEDLLLKIIAALNADLELLTQAARTAHAAATHTECLPDNKYDTTALEASYVAQGQANRAQDIRRALESYRGVTLRSFDAETPIRLTALVTLEGEDDSCRLFFLGPEAGGMKVTTNNREYIVITPESTLGRALLGRICGEELTIGNGPAQKTFTIVAVD